MCSLSGKWIDQDCDHPWKPRQIHAIGPRGKLRPGQTRMRITESWKDETHQPGSNERKNSQ